MKRFLGVRALLAATLLAFLAVSVAGAGAAAPSGTKVLARAPQLPRGAKLLGPMSASATVKGAVVLQPRDESALTRFISQVTTKKSPLFHRYLAPGAFAARFGPTQATIAAVKSTLQHEGLSVTGVARDGLIIDFSAPASRVESAFRTSLDRYKLPGGSVGYGRTSAIQVPSAIARDVTSVVGLDNLVRYHSASALRAPKSMQGTHPAAKAATFIHPDGSATPCSDAKSAAEAFGGLTDDQIANSYGAFGLYGQGDFASGQHVAIFELEPYATDDIQTFDECYFGATQATAMIGRLSTIPVDGRQAQGPGEGEATLDIQDVSAMAPGANIDVYEAPNTTFGSLDAYAQIVNDDTDQVVSSSWGICEQGIQEGSPGVQQAENILFEQAAAQGQSVFSAAGDQGSDDCNEFRTTSPVSPVLSVDDPSSQPYVVAVGGTTIDDATQPAQEHTWNDGAAWGATGGGISESWAMPAWQLASHVPGVNDPSTVSAANAFEANDLGNPSYAFCKSDTGVGGVEDGCRELPDVSAQADEFTGAVTIYAGELGFGWTTIGGTSSSAPIWAALLADTNASQTCQNNGLTDGVGFVNPLLYAVASNPTAYAESFNDITAGNNDTFGDSQLFPATTGYDMSTGLGSSMLTAPGGGAGLAANLCDMAPAVTRPTISNISPSVTSTSAPDTPGVTITGTWFEDSGTPDVAHVQVGGVEFPHASAFFNVTSPTTIVADFPPAVGLTSANDQTDGAGRYQVTVTLDDGETSAPNASSWFSYVDENGSSQPIPAVTGVHAFAGPEAGGNVVQIFGSGFTGATGVTFGGVSVGGGNFTVVNDWKILATVPAFGGGTTCDQDGSSYGTGENATNDVCQAQVVVTNANGSSNTSTILPLYEGAFAFNDHAVIPAPPGEEAAPAATEYDYLPGPTITSISTDNGPASLASEYGGTVVTIHGTGFNLAGLEGVDFGDPTQASSQNFFNLIEVTGTEIQIAAPPLDENFDTTTDTTTIPVAIQSIAGLSSPTDATYAGIPEVDGVTATFGPTAGTNAGPDTGGTPIDIVGNGFADQSLVVLFNDAVSPFSLGTQYNFSVNSDEDLTTNTVPQNPAIVDTQVFTATDCSFPTSFNNDPSDEFLLYPPGAPKVYSIAPASGPETGGTQVTITGENLGCATGVFFGSTAAEEFSNTQAFLDCGLTDQLTVTAPPGTVGTVPVTVTTVESDITGDTPTTDASFTYTAAPTLTVARTGAGAGTVTSSPSGIDCGATCSHKYAPGTPVTLTAAAAAGSVFSGWSGGGCSGTGGCIVTVNSSSSVTANFDLAPETLTVTKTGNGANGGTVTSSPAGINCQFADTTCSHPFANGTTVTLTAEGSIHVTFEGWSGGGCSGAGSCTVTMNGATSVTADFKVTGGPPVVKVCVVPKLKGKTLKAAKRALKARHCRTGKIKHAFSSKVKKGRVISQKPKPRKQLRNGAKVSLVLSKGKH
jgi:hypothetical protein